MSDTNLTNNLTTTVNDDKTNIMTDNALQISNIKNIINQTTVSILQNATIVNNIKENLNTGRNTADNNKGNVYINTGGIVSETKIINSINLSKGSSEVIFENAPQAENNIQTLNDQKINSIINNNADVKNDVTSNMNTGDNKARDNTGNVTIKTGDIISNVVIQNNVGKSVFDPVCCLSNKAPENQPLPHPIPSLPPLQPLPLSQLLVSQPLAPSQALTGAVHIAAVATHTLSLAGNNWLFFANLGNIIMYLFGAYLRLRSGNSPGLFLVIPA